jgi:hypothetical protein
MALSGTVLPTAALAAVPVEAAALVGAVDDPPALDDAAVEEVAVEEVADEVLDDAAADAAAADVAAVPVVAPAEEGEDELDPQADRRAAEVRTAATAVRRDR